MKDSSAWKHYASFIYDIFPILGIILFTSFVTLLFRGGNEVPSGTLWFRILIFAEIILYYAYSWKTGGQTLGMRAWKIKVVSQEGTVGISWFQSLIRFFIGLISTITLGMGILWKLYSKDKLSWMDLGSQTKTISEEST